MMAVGIPDALLLIVDGLREQVIYFLDVDRNFLSEITGGQRT